MKYEFVRRKEQTTVEALYAFGAAAVVARGEKCAATPVPALVLHLERELLRQIGRLVLVEKRLDEAFCFTSRDHATAT